MKKLFLLTFLASSSFFLSSKSMAQKANIGANLALSGIVGENSEFYNIGLGGDITFDYYFNDKLHLGLETGTRSYGFDSEIIDESLVIIPLLITGGLHTDLGSSIDLYGELGTGPYFTTTTIENSDTETNLGLSPRVGVAFNIKDDKLFLDFSTDYTHIFSENDDFNSLGFRAGLLYTIF